MSNIIPPLISSSPPPLDLESEEEEEFQPPILDYLYSCDDFELSNDLLDIDIPEIDINRNRKEDKDFHDKRKSSASGEFNNSDVILPNIEEIVPNINETNDDLKTADSFDAEDMEIASITHKEDILKIISGLIPKIAESITAAVVDDGVNYIQNHVELDANNYKNGRDTNSPAEIILNTELNDKTISDKELSSSEPNFESCSDNSQKDHEANDASITNKTLDKSICDVDEIDDDFGDFADFNNANSFNFAQTSNDCKNELFVNDSSLNKEKIYHSDDKLGFDNNLLEDNKVDLNSPETVAVNFPKVLFNDNIASEEYSSSSLNLNENKESEIDCTLKDLSIDNIGLEDQSSTVTTILDDPKVKPSYSANTQNTLPVKLELSGATFEDSDDEFGDFDSCTVTPATRELHEDNSPLPDLHIDRNNVTGRSTEILEIMFPVDNEQEFDFMQGGTDDDTVFSKIRNLTETNALTYQWNKSTTQQSLLKVLNVDVRNILYGPGWNPSMPIFAANLSSAPLEPQKTTLPITIASASNNFTAECTGVSEAQFDWANSGLTNPLDIASQNDVSLKECTLGEPPKSFDSESVNSLQFTEVITENIDDKSAASTDLQEFDNFTEFQAVKIAQTENPPAISSANNAMFPLRETYINSNERIELNLERLEISETVQKNPTNNGGLIQSVSYDPQKEFEISATKNSSPDDDFTEFQASLPEITLVESIQSTNRSIEYKLAIENPIEPELRNAKSSKILEPASEAWQPTILQPLKVSNANSTVRIAWPEPGITDDEIRKFEEYSYTKTSEQKIPVKVSHKPLENAKDTTSKRNAPKQTVEDEWSEFQDAAKELPLSIASLGKIVQNQYSSKVQTCITSSMALPRQDLWPNRYQPIQNDFFSPPTSVHPITGGSEQSIHVSTGMKGFDQAALNPATHRKITHQTHLTANDDEWSDFVSHQPSSFRPVSNLNPRQEDWTFRGPQFNSWTTTSVTPNILPSSSHSSTLQFNGFNSFGRSANILNSTVKSVGAVQGKNKGNVSILGVSSKRESVPSISALPELDFATSASRFSSGRLQQQKK